MGIHLDNRASGASPSMNPYEQLPETAFWKTAVATRHMLEIVGLWDPKFHITPEDKISTYGSCFAQHIGKSLKRRGYSWFTPEFPPPGLGPQNRKKFNYGVFSSRTANIYTTSLLEQWTSWALGSAGPPDEIWEHNGRCIDPFRPTIEPDGFESPSELQRCRDHTLACFRSSVVDADYLVFTLGLTEHWVNSGQNHEYPVCPGTAGGTFDAAIHSFVNHGYDETIGHLNAAISAMRSANPRLRFILTVSPVPLTATMSSQHVLVATMRSKSILRAVAGTLAERSDHIDYFPSYEIVNSPAFRGAFFEPNLRTVHSHGVSFVMDAFFNGLDRKFGPPEEKATAKAAAPSSSEVACEEELLEAFSRNP